MRDYDKEMHRRGSVVALGGMLVKIWGFMLLRRSGAVTARGHSPDGTPHPESAQWAATTLVLAIGLGFFVVLGLMEGAGPKGGATFWLGLAILPLAGWKWWRAARQERDAARECPDVACALFLCAFAAAR